jgi:GNAT superfamily N-acetyltransferase
MQDVRTNDRATTAPVVDRPLVCALERAEALQLERQVGACATSYPDAALRAVALAGGVAAITLPLFGRKLNHVTGAAMAGPFEEGALRAVEEEFAALGVSAEIDLCPYADPSALSMLAARGYRVNAFANMYWLPLTEEPAAIEPPDGVRVRQVQAPEHAAFVEWSAAGFGAHPEPRPRELRTALAESAALRSDTSLWVAEYNGSVAGSAALSLLETDHGRVAHLFLASTLPDFRGRGVQAALLHARGRVARERGATCASITARPDTSSARNAERAGYRLAYTKPTFALPKTGLARRAKKARLPELGQRQLGLVLDDER